MSFQAYLDATEDKTGKTPNELIDPATERGYGPTTKAGVRTAHVHRSVQPKVCGTAPRAGSDPQRVLFPARRDSSVVARRLVRVSGLLASPTHRAHSFRWV